MEMKKKKEKITFELIAKKKCDREDGQLRTTPCYNWGLF